MRKLRKGESYALLRSIDIAPFKTRRSLLRCAHRDDGDITGVVQSRRCIPPIVYHTKLVTLLISFICVLFSVAQAQSAGERAVNGLQEISTLEVGNTVPSEFWNKSVHVLSNGVLKHTTLEFYKGKPLLIDFWNTWCTTCIAHMPDLYNTLSYQSGQMNILLATPEEGGKVRSFMMKNDYLKDLPISSLVENTNMKRYFEHGTVPFYVLIGADGKVQTMVGLADLSLERIDELVRNPSQTYESQLTSDVISFPVLLAQQYSKLPNFFHYFFHKGENADLGSANIKRKQHDKLYSLSMLNIPARNIYHTLAKIYFETKGYPFHHTFVEYGTAVEMLDETCSLEISVPLESGLDIIQESLDMLNIRLPLSGQLVKKEIIVWELFDIDSKLMPTAEILHAGKFSRLANSLRRELNDGRLVFDTSGDRPNNTDGIDSSSPTTLKRSLANLGLGLRKINLVVPHLIIKQNDTI
ncbi:TlpA family protein disulfide reductase [Sphingobacterium olei]|uniref:TlpA family protein disulfide reductase n=1 Tax=Sphingobacterium olei TaxID=2571155 RepID=A0A4U0N8I6_9SPHI|nr:TlpA disulfide reductase family protein [Sphingobacterium olei]TJZ49903.1 TlpA family protein disulfide reductase [Sphingobacterium olei]